MFRVLCAPQDACVKLNEIKNYFDLPSRDVARTDFAFQWYIAGELDIDIYKRPFTKKLTTNDANFKLIPRIKPFFIS